MVIFDAEYINKAAPYTVWKTNIDGMLEFITDSGIRFNVGFQTSDILTCAETYQFIIVNTEHKKSPKDPKLRNTIMAIIESFFMLNNKVMLYICDTGDSKQAFRSHLFEYWSRIFPHKNLYYTTSVNILDEEEIMNYASLTLRLDHPNFAEAVNEFAELARLFSEK